MEEIRSRCIILVLTLHGRNHFPGLVVDAKIILKRILEKQHVRVYTGLYWLRIVSSGENFSTQ
jgi:hypothetical protein